MLKWLTRLAATGIAVVVLSAPVAQASNGGDDEDVNDGLGAVRHATDAFHSLEASYKAGYAPLLACFDQTGPGGGGMGQHLVKGSLLDATVVPTQPEGLVYEIRGDRLKLVAVEYIVPFTAVPSTSNPPHLFGRAFFKNTTLQLWALHAWIWRSNPMGTFANYNPNVRLCPGH